MRKAKELEENGRNTSSSSDTPSSDAAPGTAICTPPVPGTVTIELRIVYYSGTSDKGHFGGNNFVPCREVVPISEVK